MIFVIKTNNPNKINILALFLCKIRKLQLKMIKYHRLLVIIFVILFGLTACYTPNFSIYVQNSNLEEVDIEVLRPAEIDVPTDIYSVLFVVNNTVINKSELLEFDRFYKTVTKNRVENKPVNSFFISLGDIFKDSPKYRLAHKNPIFLNKDLSNSENWDSLRLLCDTNQVDAVIAIMDFTSSVYCIYDGNPFNHLLSDHGYNFEYKTKVKLFIIDPYKEEIIDHVNLNDYKKWFELFDYEISIDQYCRKNNDLFEHQLGGLAWDYAARVSPVWMSETRRYYNSMNSDLADATILAKLDKWEDAENIWKTYETSTKRNLANRSTFNLALAYEMQGDLEKSLEYAIKSYESYRNYYGIEYARLLKKRISDQERLKKQLGENNE